MSLISEIEALPTLRLLQKAKGQGERIIVAQLGQSLDGRIATETGHSHYINGDAAITLLHHLRASVDCVVVGAGTAQADDPRLTVRRCAGNNPARVLIDSRRRAGSALKMLEDDGVRRVVFGAPAQGDPEGIDFVETPPGAAMAPAQVLDALAARGLTRVLVEGGAATVSAFMAAGAVNRLCVLVAPLIIGSGRVGINLPPIDHLRDAARPNVDVMPLEGGDMVFDCELG